MSARYNTGNPVDPNGSSDPRDLFDNAANLDIAVNSSTQNTWTDRLGKPRRTMTGFEQSFQEFLLNSGYQSIGEYRAGLVITGLNQVFFKDGELYRASAALPLPYTTTGDWSAEGGLFVAVGDAVLRQELGGQNGASLVSFVQAGAEASVQTAQAKLRERVSVDDYYRPDLGDDDHTNAFERAMVYLESRSGGVIECPQPSYVAQSIRIRRFVIIEGRGPGTVLQQAAGSDRDFVTSENFEDLTGSGLDVAGDARVPSWFGLRNLRVNGNRPQNSVGRAVALYGASIVLDDLIVEEGASGGLYTEYATNVTGQTDWRTQEEGYARNVVCRRNGGTGWLNRGPHNIYIDNFIACFNDDWGYRSEVLAGKYNGAPTYVTSLHSYSNDMVWSAGSGRARRNMYIGTNMSCGLLVVDGAQCEIYGSNSLVSIVKQYFGGQGGDSLILSGNNIQIGNHYGIMRNDGVSAGFTSLRVVGNYNQIGTSNISGTYNLFDGAVISGVGNCIGDLVARNCRTALTVTGSRNRVAGRLMYNLTALHYETPADTYGGYNDLDLRIYQTTGQYVSGDGPVADKDTFTIIANGLGGTPSGTRRVLSVSALPVDTTTLQQVNIPHSLLWPDRVRDVRLTMTGLTGSSVVNFAYWRVQAVDADNITIEYRCQTAAPAGSQVSFGLEAVVN